MTDCSFTLYREPKKNPFEVLAYRFYNGVTPISLGDETNEIARSILTYADQSPISIKTESIFWGAQPLTPIELIAIQNAVQELRPDLTFKF